MHSLHSRGIVQYFAPFLSVSLHRMAEAFNTDVESMQREVGLLSRCYLAVQVFVKISLGRIAPGCETHRAASAGCKDRFAKDSRMRQGLCW